MRKLDEIITIIGGNGFIGRYVVRELVKTGAIIKIVSRSGYQEELKTCGAVGQIIFQTCDITDTQALKEVIKNSTIVINLAGIMFQRRNNNFNNVHVKATLAIAQECVRNKVKKLIHISALGSGNISIKSKYMESKRRGEEAVTKAFPNATIIRPSIVFGDRDKFLNFFCTIIKYSPFAPLIGGGLSKVQPIYVGDVAIAIAKTLETNKFQSTILQIAGDVQYSYKEIIQYIMDTMDIKRFFIKIPYCIAKIQAMLFEILSIPLLTRDQVELLKHDNIIINDNDIKTLGIKPKNMKIISKTFLR